MKVFFAKFSLPTDLQKFSPLKVYRYTVNKITHKKACVQVMVNKQVHVGQAYVKGHPYHNTGWHFIRCQKEVDHYSRLHLVET